MQIDSLFNQAYSSFLTDEVITPKPIETENQVYFEGKYDYPSQNLTKCIKEKNPENLSKLAAELRENSLVACNKAHQMQNILYKNFSDIDSQAIEKINGVCGQIENQTRAINNLLHKAQVNPTSLNDNALEQGRKQVFNKLENIKKILTENLKTISTLKNKEMAEDLNLYSENLLKFCASVV